MMADGAAGRRTQHGMMAGNVARDTAHGSAGHATRARGERGGNQAVCKGQGGSRTYGQRGKSLLSA